MSSYDRCTMFRFLFVFYFMCKALTGVLSQPELLKDIDLPPFGEHTARCKWECIIPRRFESTDSARAATKASFDKYRIVSLDLTLSKHVSSECLNETDSYRLSEPADAWMWLTLNTRLTHDRTIFARLNKSFQGQMKGRVVCTLSKDIFNTATAQLYSINDMIAVALMAELEVQYHPELAWQFGAVLCYKEKGQSLYVCLTYHKPLDATRKSCHHQTTPYYTITKLITPHTTQPSKTVEWTVRPLSGFIFSFGLCSCFSLSQYFAFFLLHMLIAIKIQV